MHLGMFIRHLEKKRSSRFGSSQQRCAGLNMRVTDICQGECDEGESQELRKQTKNTNVEGVNRGEDPEGIKKQAEKEQTKTETKKGGWRASFSVRETRKKRISRRRRLFKVSNLA